MRGVLIATIATVLLSCSHQKTITPTTPQASVDALVVPSDVPGWWQLCFAPSPQVIPGEPDLNGAPNCVGTVDQWRHAAKHLEKADIASPAIEGERAR